jgi:hypothetical protein
MSDFEQFLQFARIVEAMPAEVRQALLVLIEWRANTHGKPEGRRG